MMSVNNLVTPLGEKDEADVAVVSNGKVKDLVLNLSKALNLGRDKYRKRRLMAKFASISPTTLLSQGMWIRSVKLLEQGKYDV